MIPFHLSKAEAAQFKARWARVNRFEREELRATSPEIKLCQLAVMMSAARELGWEDSLGEGEDEVRRRWNLLRTKMDDKP